MVELTADVRWEEAERHSPAPLIPILHLDGFDGPMDLLLDLAERQRIDLGRMSIVDLAEQFAVIMRELEGTVAIERRADWLVLATRLVVLRTRLLFPASAEAAADAAREEVRELNRLDEMARMRAAAAWLGDRLQLGIDVFIRPPEELVRESGYVAMMEACLVVLRGRPGSETFKAPITLEVTIPDMWRIPQAIGLITKRLADLPNGATFRAFLPLIPLNEPDRPLKARAAIASTFAAGLELARQEVLSARQDEDMGEIVFTPCCPIAVD